MSGANVTIAGDLTISGDDLTMATNTSGAVLVGDGTNYNPAVVSGDISIGTTGVAAIGSGVILNADVNGSAAIDATKIHDGTISNTEFGYLNGVSSNIQTQIDAVESGTISTLDDDNFTLQDNADTSKKAQFQCSTISSSTTRTYTLPDASGTITVGGLSDVVSDTTPQLGGDLDLNGNNIDFPTTANISDCLDEDAMGSDSATKLATQQSIKAYVDNAAGKTDLYGFKLSNGTGSQLEDLTVTHTNNGADDISVANNDGTQSDLYDESIIANQGLTFSVNADGELNVTV